LRSRRGLVAVLAVVVVAGITTAAVALGGRSHPSRLATTSSTSTTSTTRPPVDTSTSTATAGGATPVTTAKPRTTTTSASHQTPGPRDIAFTCVYNGSASNGGIYVIHPDGSGKRRVTADAGAVDWKPTGDAFALTIGGSYPGEIDFLNADGSGRRTIRNDQYVATARWSPDSRSVLFVDPGSPLPNETGPANIWIVGANGQNPHQINPPDVHGVGADWSPDGSLIVFDRRDNFGSPSRGLWLMRLDGSNLRQIPLVVTPATPAWSPDGMWIAFSGYQGNDMAHSDIYKVHPDGTGLTQLTQSHDAVGPVWSPDAAQIAFAHADRLDANNDNPTNSTSIIGADGTGPRPLQTGCDDAWNLSWA
jgi:Tol biopolymer transport system component